MNPPRYHTKPPRAWNPRRIHPSYNDFGIPEYIDQEGREYRLATDLESPYYRRQTSLKPSSQRRDKNLTVLFVRIPKTRRKRNPSSGRLPPYPRRRQRRHRWPKRKHLLKLFSPATQHTASGSVYSVETIRPRSAVAKIKIRYWNVSELSVTDPSVYLDWGKSI